MEQSEMEINTKCADCGEERKLSCCRGCGALACEVCRVDYHSREPKMGCATQAGRKLLEEFKTKTSAP